MTEDEIAVMDGENVPVKWNGCSGQITFTKHKNCLHDIIYSK